MFPPPDYLPTLISLFQNFTLLLSLALIYTIVWPWLNRGSRGRSSVITGVIFGLFAIAATFAPILLAQGARFDGRTLMIAVSGAFAGPVGALVTTAIFLTYRILAPAVGLLPPVNLAAIATAVTIALISSGLYRRVGQQQAYRPRHLLFLGLITAAQSMLWSEFMNSAAISPATRFTGLVLLITYPAATLLIGLLLTREIRRNTLERELRASEQRFREMAESIDQVFSLRDAQTGRILYLSPAFEKIWGYPVQAALDSVDLLLSTLHPDDRDRYARERMESSSEAGRVHEFRVVRSDGALRHVRLVSYPVTEADGVVHRVAGIAEDVTQRKQMEMALHNSQHFVERIASAVPDLLYLYDLSLDGKVYENRSLVIYLGYSPEESAAMGPHAFGRLLHPDDSARLVSEEYHSRQKNLADGDVLETEYRVRNAAGEWRWFYSRDRVFQRAADGVVQQLIGIAQDITERKRSDDELRQSRHFVERIANTVPDAIFVHDLQQHVNVYMNHEVVASLGYSEEQLRAMGPNMNAMIFHPDDFSKVAFWDHQQSQLRDGDVIEYDYRLKDASGRWHWIASRHSPFLRDADGNVTQVIGIARDVTERREIEEQLRQTQHFNERVARTVPDLLYVYDFAQDKRIYANHELLYMLGYTPEQAQSMGGRSSALVHPDDLERVRVIRQQNRSMPDAGLIEWEYRIRDARGDWRWFYNRETPFEFAEGGEITQMLGISKDITDRKRSEETLQRYAEKLERNNEELQMFAYTASHDLQEPLRKIQAFGDRLQTVSGDTLSEQGKDYLQRMMNASSRMQSLIQDLLAYSRISQTDRAFNRVNLGEVAQAVCIDLEVAIARAGAQVDIGPLDAIEADPTQMRQLLQNLIGNALKFRAPDRDPVVRVAGRLKEAESGQDESEVPLYELTVSDNGIGFEEKYAERIFGMFQRLHGRNEYEGTGIGLAICRKIAERHHGTIRALSQPGQGTTFVVTIPVRQPSEEAIA